MRVLVVEDEVSLAKQLTATLRRAGYAVDHAADGEGADLLGHDENYDAVVLDLGLPKVDGFSLLRRWREAGRTMPVLVLTARGSWHEKVRGIDGGADDYMTKPFRMEELLARILIDPYAELLAAKQTVLPSAAGNLCPLCEGRPVTGVLRIEGEGGKRFLLCAFCGTEWEFRRIYCAFCGESREQSLPVFVAEKFPHIRVEACDTCRHCIRSVDLTKDGHAIPVVDDLAAIPLALWAEEYGYQRIQGNLLGT